MSLLLEEKRRENKKRRGEKIFKTPTQQQGQEEKSAQLKERCLVDGIVLLPLLDGFHQCLANPSLPSLPLLDGFPFPSNALN